jgi:hypothetical protein
MARRQTEEIDLPELLKNIRADAKYKIFKKIIETAEERCNLDKDRQEVLALHSARTSRTLYTKKRYNPSAVIEASANDMQARSRIVEIRVKLSYHLETVEKALEAIQDHVMTEYNDELRKYSNEAQRKAFIRRVQKVANNLVTDGKDLLGMCDAFIGDIDKASYHLGHLTELIKQLSQSSGGKVI